MPELPEVETVRRGLEPVLAGRRIVRAEVRRPDLRWPFPPRLAERLTGRRVVALGRRSKYLLAELDGGETLILHLGMSGRLLVSGAAVGSFHHPHPAPEKHDHVVLDIEGGARVTFNDARRFGVIDLWPTADIEAHRLLAGLGPEPLGNDFDGGTLARRLAGRRTPVKAVLGDQRVVAGLGNIYLSEALWRAGISPLRLARDVTAAEAETLAAAVRAVLIDAIAAGGSSLRDYRRADGELGYFQHSFAVYDRAGEPCPRCGGAILRTVQSGRSSFWCPACQS
ncbi:MAG TPA: bifunctional DNA-formamidopyrimidine glycosylase/DNA-(apurinic or apyrimidinic site) lyase [Amaricoccus sp.]|nr:bifunctional DNA-formamidopyrimidine glycosylase/DNA-(apurinic or apyrimidinic site) lyase [Amaricoccus sp.]